MDYGPWSPQGRRYSVLASSADAAPLGCSRNRSRTIWRRQIRNTPSAGVPTPEREAPRKLRWLCASRTVGGGSGSSSLFAQQPLVQRPLTPELLVLLCVWIALSEDELRVLLNGRAVFVEREVIRVSAKRVLDLRSDGVDA